MILAQQMQCHKTLHQFIRPDIGHCHSRSTTCETGIILTGSEICGNADERTEYMQSAKSVHSSPWILSLARHLPYSLHYSLVFWIPSSAIPALVPDTLTRWFSEYSTLVSDRCIKNISSRLRDVSTLRHIGKLYCEDGFRQVTST
jgi:hypothetical protein